MLKVEIREIEALNFNIGVIGLDMVFMTRLFDEPRRATGWGRRSFSSTSCSMMMHSKQQDDWFSFVRVLRGMYPDEATLGARLALYIAANT
jgi:hypothetical protein